MASVSYSDFEELRKHGAYIKENYASSNNPFKSSILLHTPYAGLRFFLTEQELENFYNMVEHTDNEKKVTKLLEFFE